MSRLYLDQLDASKAHLDALLTDTASTLDILSELSTSFASVEAQTSAIQTQSEGYLSEQTKSERLAWDIKSQLRHYDYLEPATRRLNAPGAGSLVRGRGFSEMLVQLDEAIDYMQAHPKQREAETYRARYKHLLTRALTLVRGHFISAVRETAADVSKRIADKQLNDTTMSTLLYAKFRVGAEEMKQLGLEIQKRASPPADADPDVEGEYQSLMNELHTSFAATRGRLIIPLVRQKLADIAQAPSTSNDLIRFARASISYIRGICLDEFELWGEWFHGYRGLYDFLESICEPLYDHLRPRTIHEGKLTKLCQLCILLQTRYMQDPDEENDILPDPNQLDFGVLIRPALEDTQTRIVFRTQAIVRNEIELYKPKSEDLDYPSRLHQRQGGPKSKGPVLSGRRESAAPTTPTTPLPRDPLIVDADISSDEENANNLSVPYDPSSTMQRPTIYPTLNLCLTILTRLHRLIHTSIFDDLAHQIVHQTLISLTTASASIPPPTKAQLPPSTPNATAKTPTTPSSTSSNLFLLIHLLHLKTHLLAFDISSNTANPDVSVDFSGPLSTFTELRERGTSLFNPVNLMRLISSGTLLPRVVENMLDAKVELDGSLRKVINNFVGDWSNLLTSSLTTIPSPPKQQPPKSQTNNKSSTDSSTDKASSLVTQTRTKITTLVPVLRSTLETWTLDPRVTETLIAAIMEYVVKNYELWFDDASARGVVNGRRTGGAGTKGKGREDEVWDVDGFQEWCEGIFQVRVMELEEEEDDGESGNDEDARSV